MADAQRWLQPDELGAWITMIALLETFPAAVDAVGGSGGEVAEAISR